MKYRSRVHGVLVMAGFAVALLPPTLGAALGSLAAIYALPVLFTAPLVLIPIAVSLWGLVSGWRLFLFFTSGKNEPGAGCWLGVVAFIILALCGSLWETRHRIPYLTIAIGLHWLWLYYKDFRISWD